MANEPPRQMELTMSISMEHFESDVKLFAPHPAGGSPLPCFPYRLQCRSCNFEPVDSVIAPRRCPKCSGSAWERFVFPRSLLMRADPNAIDIYRAPRIQKRTNQHT
jgi:hypothetical protein